MGVDLVGMVGGPVWGEAFEMGKHRPQPVHTPVSAFPWFPLALHLDPGWVQLQPSWLAVWTPPPFGFLGEPLCGAHLFPSSQTIPSS